jgi:tRNA threonylcarbamoyladenosine biosynthesis protein TsaB
VRVLGIDTATWTASVGAIDGDSTLAESSRVVDRGNHAAILLPMVEAVLRAAGVGLSDLQLLAVSIGPGSFTGLRIGLSVAKGFSLAAGVPIVGVPTLEALARVPGRLPGLVCPVLDARKKEVYGAAFRWSGDTLEQVCEAAVLEPHRFAARLSTPCTLIGDGVDAYESVWRACFGDDAVLIPFRDCSPRGSSVALIGRRLAESRGVDDAARLVPIYLRKPEAEVRHEMQRRGVPSPGVEKLTGSGR